MAVSTKGGRVTIQISGSAEGAIALAARAKLDIDPSLVEIAAGANQDGTGWRTVKAVLVEAKVTFDRGIGLAWDAAMMLDNYDVTFVEDDVGVTHLFTGATFVGKPSLSTETGEVSGVSIQTDTYSVLGL
jgi:hypothetical protein